MVGVPKVPLGLRDADFGPYTIVRRLGVGGTAETFEAIRHGPGGFSQRVCLKLALPFLRRDEAFIQLFQREARLAATLRHSNIVGVLDYGNVDGTPFMALELVDGVDLLALLESGRRLSYEQVAFLAGELAKALNHAHDPPTSAHLKDNSSSGLGVIHRDLSPSNVMLSQQGEVMLADFGVAKAMFGASRHQSAVKGKIPYMSPEQLRNETLDARSDLFSLGVVLFESLSGVHPFDGGNDPSTIMRILNGDRASLSDEAHHAPSGFCRIVESLIETDPRRRPASAADVVEALDEFAPPPRTQRELGRLVSGVLANRVPELGQPPLVVGDSSSASTTAMAPGSETASADSEPARSTVPALLVAVFVAAMLMGLAFFASRLLT